MQELMGSLSAFGINVKELEKAGLKIPDSVLSGTKKEVCFDTKDGRFCELLPSSSGITCRKDGICDIYAVSPNSDLVRNKDMLNALGIKIFLQPSGAFPLIGLSGRFSAKDLEAVKSIVGKRVPVRMSSSLRPMVKGHVKPPNQCNMFPFLPDCKNYIENPEWAWLPLKGWFETEKTLPNLFDTFRRKIRRGGDHETVVSPAKQ